MSSFGSWTGSTCKQFESTLPYLNQQKIPNFVESKLSTWQNIDDSNMNKRSDWKYQTTI
jgi:hypothetical protein